VAKAHRAAYPTGIEAEQPCSGGCGRQQRHLPVLMGQGSRRESAGEPGGDVVAEQQSGQHVAAAAAFLLADRQQPGSTCMAA